MILLNQGSIEGAK